MGEPLECRVGRHQPENEMAKTEKIEVRIPAETMAELQAVANSAGLKAEQVMALALAVDMRRWNRESGIRAERDALRVFAQEVALGAYKPKELRARAQAVIAATSYVPPNTQIQRAP